MGTEPPARIWSTVDLVKIGAGSLAAVSAAVAASTLGVAGTLAGAALASVVGSVGTELYANSLDRARNRLSRTRAGLVAGGAPESMVEETSADVRTEPAVRPVSPPPPERGRSRWKRVALAAAAVFLLAMAALTAFELLAGRSVAALFGDESAGSTTIGSTVDDVPAATPEPERSAVPDEETPSPSEESPSPTPSATPEPSPAESPAPEPAPASRPATEDLVPSP